MVVVEKAVGLAEAREVEPIVRHALGVGGRGEQAIDEPLVRVGRRVGDERVDLLERRRQARQRQRDAADQGFLVGRGATARGPRARGARARSGRCRSRRAARAPSPGTAGRWGSMNAQCGRYSAPFSIHCSRIAICLRRERLVRRLRRHALVDVRSNGCGARARCGSGRRARSRTCPAFRAARPSRARRYRAASRLARRRVGAVALEAVLRQDRPDVPVVVDLVGAQPLSPDPVPSTRTARARERRRNRTAPQRRRSVSGRCAQLPSRRDI